MAEITTYSSQTKVLQQLPTGYVGTIKNENTMVRKEEGRVRVQQPSQLTGTLVNSLTTMFGNLTASSAASSAAAIGNWAPRRQNFPSSFPVAQNSDFISTSYSEEISPIRSVLRPNTVMPQSGVSELGRAIETGGAHLLQMVKNRQPLSAPISSPLSSSTITPVILGNADKKEIIPSDEDIGELLRKHVVPAKAVKSAQTKPRSPGVLTRGWRWLRRCWSGKKVSANLQTDEEPEIEQARTETSDECEISNAVVPVLVPDAEVATQLPTQSISDAQKKHFQSAVVEKRKPSSSVQNFGAFTGTRHATKRRARVVAEKNKNETPTVFLTTFKNPSQSSEESSSQETTKWLKDLQFEEGSSGQQLMKNYPSIRNVEEPVEKKKKSNFQQGNAGVSLSPIIQRETLTHVENDSDKRCMERLLIQPLSGFFGGLSEMLDRLLAHF